MFNLGISELILIGVIALIFIGPKQLPEVARSVAKFLNELKRAGSEASQALMSVRHEADRVVQDSFQSLPRLDSEIVPRSSDSPVAAPVATADPESPTTAVVESPSNKGPE